MEPMNDAVASNSKQKNRRSTAILITYFDDFSSSKLMNKHKENKTKILMSKSLNYFSFIIIYNKNKIEMNNTRLEFVKKM